MGGRERGKKRDSVRKRGRDSVRERAKHIQTCRQRESGSVIVGMSVTETQVQRP